MSFMQSIPRPVTTYRTETYDRISKNHGFDGKGKTILVTGGSNGVGVNICKAFARAGVARIAIVSRSQEEQKNAKAELEAAYPDTQILTYSTSITEYEQVVNILKELGSVDVVVLNAAIAHRRVEGKNLETKEVQDAFDVNTVATFNLTSAYLSDSTPKPACGRKTVINISSAAVQFFGYRMGYGASKAAAVQIMQAFAAENPGDDVRVFSFHPGSLYTPGVAQNWPKDAMQWDDINLPADFAVWLAGPDSDFLHGRYMWANWDVDELIALKDKVAEKKNFLTIGLVL